MSEFCKLLKQKKIQKHMKSKDVANLFGWTAMYYGRYENGDIIPTKHNILIFAKFLDISEFELIDILKKEK